MYRTASEPAMLRCVQAFTWSEPKPLIMLRVMQGMDGNDDDPTRGLKYNCSDLDEI